MYVGGREQENIFGDVFDGFGALFSLLERAGGCMMVMVAFLYYELGRRRRDRVKCKVLMHPVAERKWLNVADASKLPPAEQRAGVGPMTVTGMSIFWRG